jgi:NTP pyrophosphatase (non-canonical NTP hydrolase)
MEFDQYQASAHCTEAPITAELLARFTPDLIRLWHGACGLCTEVGEFQDALKAHCFYGKPLDAVNLAEEIGDIMWYMALVANTLGIDLADIAAKNIAKLRTRYPAKFSKHDATNRRLDAERKILEGTP